MQRSLPGDLLHAVPLRALTAEAFAPYGQVIQPRRSLGQFVMPEHNAGTGADEAQLTLDGGIPRLWIMHLANPVLQFEEIARHRRVTQCLGSICGAEWIIAVAPPDLDAAAPALADITGFRVPPHHVIKLHIGTWHAGPHFEAPEAWFLNLENMNTRREDFEAAMLPAMCRYDFG